MKLEKAEVTSGFRSVGEAIRASLSDGQGYYLVAMVLFGVAASFLHRVLAPTKKYYESLASLVNLTQEPYRGETRPTLAAGITGRPEDPGDLCAQDKMLDDIEWVVRTLNEQLAQLPPVDIDKDFEPCTGDRCPYQTPGMGPAWRDKLVGHDHSQLILPATAIPHMLPADYSVLKQTRFIGSEQVAALLGKDYSSNGKGQNTYSIQNIYFIDMLGSIRIAPAMSDSEELASFRAFSGASYVYDAFGNDRTARQRGCASRRLSGYATLRYLDLTGKGIVQTICYRVGDGRPPRTTASPAPSGHPAGFDPAASAAATGSSSGAAATGAAAPAVDSATQDAVPPKGVACFDVSPSLKQIGDILDRASEIFDLSIVRFQGPLPASCDDPEPSPLCSSPRLSTLERRVVGMLAGQWRPKSQNPAHSPSALSAGASAVRELGQGYFGAVIHVTPPRDGHVEQTDVVFGQLRRGHSAELWWLGGFVLFAAGASGFVARGALRRSRRAEAALIRGLPVGVIEVHDKEDVRDSEIVRGNDRAEELLHHALPSFGSSRAGPPVAAGEVFDVDRVVLLNLDGTLTNGYDTVTMATVNAAREEGYSSRYYVFARYSKRWLAVFGSPIITPSQSIETHAILQPCDHREHLANLLKIRSE